MSHIIKDRCNLEEKENKIVIFYFKFEFGSLNFKSFSLGFYSVMLG